MTAGSPRCMTSSRKTHFPCLYTNSHPGNTRSGSAWVSHLSIWTNQGSQGHRGTFNGQPVLTQIIWTIECIGNLTLCAPIRPLSSCGGNWAVWLTVPPVSKRRAEWFSWGKGWGCAGGKTTAMVSHSTLSLLTLYIVWSLITYQLIVPNSKILTHGNNDSWQPKRKHRKEIIQTLDRKCKGKREWSTHYS